MRSEVKTGYEQRLSTSGVGQSADDGILLCSAGGTQSRPTIVSDDNGGAIVCWDDRRAGNNIYAQRVDGSGTRLWAAEGVPVATANPNQSYHKSIRDGNGGAVVAFGVSGGSAWYGDIYAQRIDALGAIHWTAGGVALCETPADWSWWPTLTTDGAGGAVVTWQECEGADQFETDIRVQWVTRWGTVGDQPVSVEIADFRATPLQESILLEWSSTDIVNFSHFFVRRSAIASDGDFFRLSERPVEGGEVTDRDYSYLDTDVIPGTLYYYKLEAVEPGGGSVFFGPYPVVATERRAQYSLSQNIPNPFGRGSETTIHYSVVEAGRVQIRILDVAGRLVRTIAEEARPGENQIRWNGTDQNGRQVPSGVYFYEINADGFSAERKMLLVN